MRGQPRPACLVTPSSLFWALLVPPPLPRSGRLELWMLGVEGAAASRTLGLSSLLA